jgi:hypothetical protein
MFIVIGFGIGSVVTVLLQCLPLSALWDAEKAAGAHCIKVIDFYYANAAISLAADVTILMLPIKVLWGLHMPLRQRIGLCALFGLGGLCVVPVFTLHFRQVPRPLSPPESICSIDLSMKPRSLANLCSRACVAGISRLTSLKSLLASTNITVDLVGPLNWSIIELNTAIFIAGAPALKALLRSCMPTVLGTSYSAGGTKCGSTNQPGTNSRATKHNSIPLGSMHDKNDANWVQNTAVVSSAPRESVHRERESDNESQENIMQNYHGILQEVTVSVRSERKSEEERSMGSTKVDY